MPGSERLTIVASLVARAVEVVVNVRPIHSAPGTIYVAVLACALSHPAVARTVQGVAAYRERIALPQDAVFEAVLQDVSRADAPAQVLGRARLAPAGQPPFKFEIPYDDGAVQPGHRYVVRAKVTAQGRLLYTTDRSYPALDGSSVPLQLRLVSAAHGQVLIGMFLYMADAASLTLCRDGRRLPVMMEGDYRRLEVAYLDARRDPGEPLLVEIEGSISSRPPAEEGARPRTVVVVKRFIAVRPGATCENLASQRRLRNTYWKLVRLGESPVEVVDQQQEPHLVLAADQTRVSGSGGCNRLSGAFQLEGNKLSFHGMAGTLRACPKGMEQETRFLQTLDRVKAYRIDGSRLEALDAAGAVLARFEAVDLR
jgi:uncharacterized lipoprotein YbaY/heat shock protein HslJ